MQVLNSKQTDEETDWMLKEINETCLYSTFKWVQFRCGLRSAEPADQTQIIRARFVVNVVMLKPEPLRWGEGAYL